MPDNFSNLMPNTKPQMLEAQRTPSKTYIQEKLHLGISYSTFQKPKTVERILEEKKVPHLQNKNHTGLFVRIH